MAIKYKTYVLEMLNEIVRPPVQRSTDQCVEPAYIAYIDGLSISIIRRRFRMNNLM